MTSRLTLRTGECLTVMRDRIGDETVDAVVTDPPYGLGFMGRKWDKLPPGVEWASECLRVLKPGGYLLAFGGTRTWHRLACAVEDAGFELRDSIAWLYGSGFPKSMDVAKAIDKAAGVEPIDLGASPNWRESKRDREKGGRMEVRGANAGRVTAPATDAARQWEGWGTALKPAFEPIVVARKPLIGTVTANVLTHGTGALNIDGCRIGDDTSRADRYNGKPSAGDSEGYRLGSRTEPWVASPGRWPTNVVLDESQAADLDAQSGTLPRGHHPAVRGGGGISTGGHAGQGGLAERYAQDTGGASRFFPTFRYQAKAPTSERPLHDGRGHPTVKPLALMRWLVRLVTPPDGLVLDTFLGSGTTAEAALLEGFRVFGIDDDPHSMQLTRVRLSKLVTS